jgi:hypothetical protein
MRLPHHSRSRTTWHAFMAAVLAAGIALVAHAQQPAAQNRGSSS